MPNRTAVEALTEGGNGSSLKEMATEKLESLSAKAKDALHTANNTTLAELEKKAADYVRTNPGRTIAAAAVVGILLGMYLRRR